jgi:hypothetical protein
MIMQNRYPTQAQFRGTQWLPGLPGIYEVHTTPNRVFDDEILSFEADSLHTLKRVRYRLALV